MEALWQDLRYTARMLLKNPGFATLAIVVLALGIGANSGIFSVVNSVLLKPLPYREPDRLVVALHSGQFPVSPADYLDYKHDVPAFEQMAAAEAWGGTLRGAETTEVVSGMRVTANMMPMLGIEPLIGRVFSPDEDQPGAHPVILLSHGLWQRRFAADPRILGQTITLTGKPYTVIGVMPANFRFATPVGEQDQRSRRPLTASFRKAQAGRFDSPGAIRDGYRRKPPGSGLPADERTARHSSALSA